MYKLFVGTLPDCRRGVEGAYLVACGGGGQLEHLVPFAGCLQQVCYKGLFDLGMNAQDSFLPAGKRGAHLLNVHKAPRNDGRPGNCACSQQQRLLREIQAHMSERASTQETYPI